MENNGKEDTEIISLAHTLLDRVTGSWMSQAIYVAAELGIADLLAEGPRTSEDLAAATDADVPSLHRLLRALTTIDICKERDDGSFEITPMGTLIGTNSPWSLRFWIMWWGSHLWQVWGNLLYSVKTGKSARELITRTGEFKHLERDSRMAEVFNRGIVDFTRLTSESVIRGYDFSAFRRIMDVGGGYGELLVAILRAAPSVSGILFDLPHAIEGGRRCFEEAGLTSRCEFMEGDFFESVPGGADAYILKSVIHDWNDEKGRTILENCRRAMSGRGLLLLVERVFPDRLEVSVDHQALVRSDLTMLVAHAAGERTEKEFRNLVESAGFTVMRFIPIGMTFNIIEAIPLR